MNYDITLISKASVIPARTAMPDHPHPRERRGQPVARSIQLRRSCSAWLYRLAARIAPRPAGTDHDELFAAIATLLAEPQSERSTLNATSQRGC
jgi:hypothetical protein